MTSEEVLIKIITDNVNLKIEIEGLKECLDEIRIKASMIQEYCDPNKSLDEKEETMLLDEITTETIIGEAYHYSLKIIEDIKSYLE